MAVTITNPLEVVKVRLQLQGELVRRGQFKVVYKHLPHGMFVIARQEGAGAAARCVDAMSATTMGTAWVDNGAPSNPCGSRAGAPRPKALPPSKRAC